MIIEMLQFLSALICVLVVLRWSPYKIIIHATNQIFAKSTYQFQAKLSLNFQIPKKNEEKEFYLITAVKFKDLLKMKTSLSCSINKLLLNILFHFTQNLHQKITKYFVKIFELNSNKIKQKRILKFLQMFPFLHFNLIPHPNFYHLMIHLLILNLMRLMKLP